MRKFVVLAVPALFSFSLLNLSSTTARADDKDADDATAEPAPAPAADAKSPAAPEAPDAQAPADFKALALELNPLAASIGRYSIQGEYLPAMHHALTLNPFYTHAPVKETINGVDVDGGALNGFGGELGYRFYTGSRGPNGFFVGPSFLFASYSSKPAGGGDSTSFTSVGGAIDIGGQGVIGPGVIVGGGFGLQYTKNSKDLGPTGDLNLASAIIAGGGVRPRFLLTVGYAF